MENDRGRTIGRTIGEEREEEREGEEREVGGGEEREVGGTILFINNYNIINKNR